MGVDANEQHRNEIAEEVARNVAVELKLDDTQLDSIRRACGRTRLLDITEFGRPVHAEMDALLSCARAGISLEDPETRAIWNAALRARDEVASWPAWKRGEEDPPAESEALAPSATASDTSNSR